MLQNQPYPDQHRVVSDAAPCRSTQLYQQLPQLPQLLLLLKHNRDCTHSPSAVLLCRCCAVLYTWCAELAVIGTALLF